jgi:hypothetical protein
LLLVQAAAAAVAVLQSPLVMEAQGAFRQAVVVAVEQPTVARRPAQVALAALGWQS